MLLALAACNQKPGECRAALAIVEAMAPAIKAFSADSQTTNDCKPLIESIAAATAKLTALAPATQSVGVAVSSYKQALTEVASVAKREIENTTRGATLIADRAQLDKAFVDRLTELDGAQLTPSEYARVRRMKEGLLRRVDDSSETSPSRLKNFADYWEKVELRDNDARTRLRDFCSEIRKYADNMQQFGELEAAHTKWNSDLKAATGTVDAAERGIRLECADVK